MLESLRTFYIISAIQTSSGSLPRLLWSSPSQSIEGSKANWPTASLQSVVRNRCFNLQSIVQILRRCSTRVVILIGPVLQSIYNNDFKPLIFISQSSEVLFCPCLLRWTECWRHSSQRKAVTSHFIQRGDWETFDFPAEKRTSLFTITVSRSDMWPHSLLPNAHRMHLSGGKAAKVRSWPFSFIKAGIKNVWSSTSMYPILLIIVLRRRDIIILIVVTFLWLDRNKSHFYVGAKVIQIKDVECN
jgi:hypothetical protein